MKSRLLSLSVKLTATTVLLTVLVVGIFGLLTLQTVSEDVEQQTERLVEIRTETLDEVGSTTSRYLALPAASPMYDNDLGALYGLLQPVVDAQTGNDAVYGYIVATTGRTWVVSVDEQFSELRVDDGPPLFKATDDPRAPELRELVDPKTLVPYQDLDALPLRENITRTLVTKSGESRELQLQQYTSAIVDRNGELLGYLSIAYSLDQLQAEVVEIESRGNEKQDAMRKRIALLGSIAVVLGVLIAVFQSLAITRNVKRLSRAARAIAQGNLAVRTNVRSSDEIGELGRHFNVMADQVQALLIETEQKAMLEKELDIARMIQETLLPGEGLFREHGVSFAGFFRAASVCGGDFWQYNTLDDGRVILSIGDVTGHGVPSAMISAAAKSGLDTVVNICGPSLQLPTMLTELNKTIYDAARRKLVMTFLAMEVDTQRKTLRFANAGHNFPILLRNTSGTVDARALVARGNRLGDDRNSLFESLSVELMVGDTLFLYSDGLTEYRDESGKEYGERRLRRLLTANAHAAADTLLNIVVQDLSQFAGRAPQDDDVTIVVAKVDA